MSAEPDELYTLRAQYWLGHYALALEEARSVARRPMSPGLKAEREEYAARAMIALQQYDRLSNNADNSPALQALSLKAKCDAAMLTHAPDSAVVTSIVDEIKSFLATHSSNPAVQLTAAQVLASVHQVKEALQAISGSNTNKDMMSSSSMSLEHAMMQLQMYLKLDRLDLARTMHATLKRLDEDSIVTQLGFVYVNLATGTSTAGDVVHTLNSLTEQYGPSPYLLNLMACALMQQGDYAGAEQRLEECLRDAAASSSGSSTMIADTYINLLVAKVHQGKTDWKNDMAQLHQLHPTLPYGMQLERVQAAFDREAVKYKTAA